MLKIDKISRHNLSELAELFKELSGNEQSVKKMEENFLLMEKNEDYIILGAMLNGKLVGSLMGIVCMDLVDDCRPFMVIENVVVSENCRRQGIGKKLMLEIESVCISRNCYYNLFVSGSKRTDAHKFYESMGYKPDVVRGFKKYFLN